MAAAPRRVERLLEHAAQPLAHLRRAGSRGAHAVREIAREHPDALVEHRRPAAPASRGSGGRRPGSRGPPRRTIVADPRLELAACAGSGRSAASQQPPDLVGVGRALLGEGALDGAGRRGDSGPRRSRTGTLFCISRMIFWAPHERKPAPADRRPVPPQRAPSCRRARRPLAGVAALTHAELDRAGNRLARALARARDRAAATAWSAGPTPRLEVLPLFVALAKLGAVFAPLSARLGEEEARAVLAHRAPGAAASRTRSARARARARAGARRAARSALGSLGAREPGTLFARAPARRRASRPRRRISARPIRT